MRPMRRALLAGLLVAAIGLAYGTSLQGAFVLDDYADVLDNPRLRRGWPPAWLLGTSRPVVDATLALNTALGGSSPWGYHALNILIHMLAALTLWALLRRGMARWLPMEPPARADAVAWAAALLWAVHPLQTQAVTYVIQRGESLAGLWMLLSLYALTRSLDDARARWRIAAVAASALAMATKPIAVVLPALAVLWDWMRAGRPLRALWRGRRGLYLALASTWIVLAACLWAGRDDYLGTAGPGTWTAPGWRYLLTQPAVLAHYLRLAAWLAPLVFDDAWPPAHSARALIGGAAAIALTLWALARGLRRRHPIALAAAWSLLALAPSSLIPMLDVAAEHRAYLALAAPIALAVLGVWRALQRVCGPRALPIARPILAASALALIGATAARNAVYRDEAALWRDTLAKRPENPRAWGQVGIAHAEAGRLEEAAAHLQQALRRDPREADWHYNLGAVRARQGRRAEADGWFAQALALRPRDAGLLRDVGIALARQGRPARAVRCLEEAIRWRPDDDRARFALATVLREQAEAAGALEQYRAAIAGNPRHAHAHHDLGLLLAQRGRLGEAATHVERAARLDPQDPRTQATLSLLHAQQRLAGARERSPSDDAMWAGVAGDGAADREAP
jgi:tetratricopeptide (TPR) repeat protein